MRCGIVVAGESGSFLANLSPSLAGSFLGQDLSRWTVEFLGAGSALGSAVHLALHWHVR